MKFSVRFRLLSCLLFGLLVLDDVLDNLSEPFVEFLNRQQLRKFARESRG